MSKGPGWELPEKRYGVTNLYMALRACERFGVDPLGNSELARRTVAMMDAGTEVEQVLAYNRVRDAERASEVRAGVWG